jgi:hypothetical protein
MAAGFQYQPDSAPGRRDLHPVGCVVPFNRESRDEGFNSRYEGIVEARLLIVLKFSDQDFLIQISLPYSTW